MGTVFKRGKIRTSRDRIDFLASIVQAPLEVHHSLADLEVPASKRLPHSSGARFLSTCNCGHSQALRNDPFTLKEANYDFYMQSHFECCQDFERYEFEVFEQEATEGKLDDVESLDESLVSPKQSLVQSVYSVVEEDLEMLLDRDNRLEVDELHRDSPFKITVGFHHGRTYLRLERVGVNSGISAEDLEIDDEETAVMEEKKDVVEEKDEPQQLAVEDEDDEDPELTKLVEPSGIRHLKAHMDEYTDVWSDEDEDEDVRSEGGERAPSYLDMAEEVQPREEPNTEIAKKLHTSAISFEEELAQLKKLCR
ncbi:unnamed protein product, partial [Gongylonema pulchrum]|uniref:Nonsense-mediated mRNA decay factor SMG8 n=1 Tax=Gongylonema pulchrum TaxID=637853 RepID=A0A183EN34_9BILA